MPRAVVVERPGGPGVLVLTELPARRLAAHEVRVAVQAAGVNPVDAGNRADPSWAEVSAPYVVGYEFAGQVTEVGSEVRDLSVDDAVWGLLPVRGTRWGAYAEQVIADAEFVARRPEGLSQIETAAVPLAGTTALQLVERLAPAPGEWMLVHGAAGGVGHLLVQIALARGAHIAAPARRERFDLLHQLGVDLVVDRDQPDPILAARRAVGADFGVVADLVGGGLLAASLDVIANGGRGGAIVDLTGDLEAAIDRNVALHGVLVRPGREALVALGALVQGGKLRPVIDEVLSLAEASRAHEHVERRRGPGKIVLRVSDHQPPGVSKFRLSEGLVA